MTPAPTAPAATAAAVNNSKMTTVVEEEQKVTTTTTTTTTSQTETQAPQPAAAARKRSGPSPAVLTNELMQLRRQLDQLEFRAARQRRRGDVDPAIVARTQARLEGLRRTHQWLKRVHVTLHPLGAAAQQQHLEEQQKKAAAAAAMAAAKEEEQKAMTTTTTVKTTLPMEAVDNSSAPQAAAPLAVSVRS